MKTNSAGLTNVPRNGRTPSHSRSAVIIPICVLIFGSLRVAKAATPLITAASIDTVTNTLTITGTNLLGADSLGVFKVTLGAILLTVATQSNSAITATFPPVAPASTLAAGNYPLTVTFFGAQPNTATFSVFVGVQTRLLFSFVNTDPGFDTGIAISNIGVDPTTGSTGSSGACILYLLGRGAGANPTVRLPLSGNIVAGTWEAIELSNVKPGFEGYIMASCPFKASGVALFSDAGIRNWATAIPAIVNP